jgi:hypothetical protein
VSLAGTGSGRRGRELLGGGVIHRRGGTVKFVGAAHRTIGDMTDDDADRPEPVSAKAVTALLREARSTSCPRQPEQRIRGA